MKQKYLIIKSLMLVAIFCLSVVFLSNFVTESHAIPSFVRKYETSCTTCHVAFPKLNHFGESFRLNGYIIPVTDEDFIKEEPIKLGAEAYKRVWPDAIWPNSIPGRIPLAIRVNYGFDYRNGEEVESAFSPPSVNLFTAGAFSEGVSFYVGVHLFEHGEFGSLGRAFVRLNNMFDNPIPHTQLYLKLGQFIPDVVPFADHRYIFMNSFSLNSYNPSMGSGFQMGHVHAGSAGFNLESLQLGAELTGIVAKRLKFGVGLVNGNGSSGENNNAKDGYIRLAYKFGGMALDGSTGDDYTEELSDEDNLKEYSIRLGVFGYKGGADNSGAAGPRDLDFSRVGFDVSAYIMALNLFGGYITGSDTVMEGTVEQELDYGLFFAEGDYLLNPWLMPALRYERANPDRFDSFGRVIAHLSVLARANLKIMLESVFDTDDFDFENFHCMFEYGY